MHPPINAVVISEFSLPTDIQTLFTKFWLDKQWYENFLNEVLEDKNIFISEWVEKENVRSRNVESYHPSKVSFPGLPSHAESMKLQRVMNTDGCSDTSLFIHESSSFNGIPYSDYFTVQTYWSFSSNLTSDDLSPECHVSISMQCVFLKYTWLQSTIESNTKAELLLVFNKWREFALQYLAKDSCSSDSNTLSLKSLSLLPAALPKGSLPGEHGPQSQSSRAPSVRNYTSEDEGFYDCEEGDGDAGDEFDAESTGSESLTFIPPHGSQGDRRRYLHYSGR